jgi:hypothetical protein
VVWCGVVWCGVVWCGVVWCGVVWCGVVWFHIVCTCVLMQVASAAQGALGSGFGATPFSFVSGSSNTVSPGECAL